MTPLEEFEFWEAVSPTLLPESIITELNNQKWMPIYDRLMINHAKRYFAERRLLMSRHCMPGLYDCVRNELTTMYTAFAANEVRERLKFWATYYLCLERFLELKGVSINPHTNLVKLDNDYHAAFPEIPPGHKNFIAENAFEYNCLKSFFEVCNTDLVLNGKLEEADTESETSSDEEGLNGSHIRRILDNTYVKL